MKSYSSQFTIQELLPKSRLTLNEGSVDVGWLAAAAAVVEAILAATLVRTFHPTVPGIEVALEGNKKYFRR